MPFDFWWKCRWNIRLRKMWAFLPAECLHRIPCLFHVWTIHGVCPTSHRQWADSLVPQGTLGNPKIVCGLRTHPRSAPNLERHGSSKMQTFGWLEMPHFLNRISRCIPSEIGRMCFFFYYFSLQKGLSVSSDCPAFLVHRKMLPIQEKTDIIDKE